MMEKNVSIHSTSILAVEGKDECNFFNALLGYQNINTVQLVDVGGKDKFELAFAALSNLEGFDKIDRLGFIRDAEDNQAQSAFNSICKILKKYRLPTPLRQNGIDDHNVPCIGIFIMPDNTGTGMIEDLCLETIKAQPVHTCIEQFVDCFSKYQNQHEKHIFNGQKARVQAYLATRSPIRNSLGLGAMRGYWDFAHPSFDKIKKFLETLYQSCLSTIP